MAKLMYTLMSKTYTWKASPLTSFHVGPSCSCCHKTRLITYTKWSKIKTIQYEKRWINKMREKTDLGYFKISLSFFFYLLMYDRRKNDGWRMNLIRQYTKKLWQRENYLKGKGEEMREKRKTKNRTEMHRWWDAWIECQTDARYSNRLEMSSAICL